MSNYKQAINYLYSLRNNGSSYGIDRMHSIMHELGDPQKSFPIIHVAGTNGKGSVCAMLEILYRESGYKTALFTSPHLINLGERIQVNRTCLSEQDLLKKTEVLRPIADKLALGKPTLKVSFFEFITAMAFKHFAEKNVDIACIETGLGGRLDATNVVQPELSIITTISLDHTDLLGDSIEKIAFEKGGIIKPKKPVLIGNVAPSAEAILRSLAKERDSPVYSIHDRYKNPALRPHTNLSGDYQRWNAATAIYATEILSEKFPLQPSDALSNVDWPGRWQVTDFQGKTLIFDTTHNAEGCQQLIEQLKQLTKKPIVIAGALGEDRGKTIMKALSPYVSELYLVAPNDERAASTNFLISCLPQKLPYTPKRSLISELFPSVGHCAVGQKGDTILITGSIQLIGEIQQRLTKNKARCLSNLQDKI
ncbi:MAG: folylpolyglutamate synthase/dihydrofolate synthase family protein [Verrucomicrobiota bacterium]|nr:folylpolyglutamate synthase/dihydrofolate synthase family protein [Verrucomicrobiota bacterium]